VVAQVLGSRIPVARPLDDITTSSKHEDARRE
jgi:1-deoxy-D-xylulose-5-phosphate synthase